MGAESITLRPKRMSFTSNVDSKITPSDPLDPDTPIPTLSPASLRGSAFWREGRAPDESDRLSTMGDLSDMVIRNAIDHIVADNDARFQGYGSASAARAARYFAGMPS